MFRKFDPSEDISSQQLPKSSAVRTIRAAMLKQFPAFTDPSIAPAAPVVPVPAEDAPAEDAPAEDATVTEDVPATTEAASGAKEEEEEEAEPVPNIGDIVFPSTTNFKILKSRHFYTIFSVNDKPQFVQLDEGDIFPTLRVLQRFPRLMPGIYVDKGAVRPLMGGSDLMVPGIYKPSLEAIGELPAGTVVAVYAIGLQHPFMIGRLTYNVRTILGMQTGNVVENLHTMGDGLWEHSK
ncbi:hypothetical protein H696_05125 [Fonticula alba]|uniref:Uncharacterized protein n=1 Tax=Fonticula alba TaxID=691883 RepID=A0A058Z229_FONAL|nr:hypothetical protein H696_05125 [Fonticula alba]KCV68196.1 hypothetical protein H696_05125 [Fonticula alba]|eukprot:XP_009497250.1 hypothetical protein H696_05125 [Fonticula alba]